MSGDWGRASGYGLGEGLGDPVPDGAVVFPGSVGDVLPEAVPDPGVAGMYDWYSGSVESRTGSCTSADVPVESSLTRTVTRDPGDPVVGSSSMAGGWAKDVSPLALTGIDTVGPEAPEIVTTASLADVLNTVPMIRPGWSAPWERMSMSASFIGPTTVWIPLVAGVIFVVSAGLSEEQPAPARSSTPSVRAAIADLNPANRVVGATAGSSRQKAVRSPPIIVPGGGKIDPPSLLVAAKRAAPGGGAIGRPDMRLEFEDPGGRTRLLLG